VQHLFLTAHERPQSATNDFDIPERPAPKFDLGLESTNVSHCLRQDNKAVNTEAKTGERGFNEPHFILITQQGTIKLNKPANKLI